MSKMAELDYKIKKHLINLGFNVRSKGVLYWVEAIILYDETKKIKDIYTSIAKNHNTNIGSIDRAMRTAMKPAIDNIKKMYNYDYKITVKAFLNLIYFYKERID